MRELEHSEKIKPPFIPSLTKDKRIHCKKHLNLSTSICYKTGMLIFITENRIIHPAQ